MMNWLEDKRHYFELFGLLLFSVSGLSLVVGIAGLGGMLKVSVAYWFLWLGGISYATVFFGGLAMSIVMYDEPDDCDDSGWDGLCSLCKCEVDQCPLCGADFKKQREK